MPQSSPNLSARSSELSARDLIHQTAKKLSFEFFENAHADQNATVHHPNE